MLSHSFCGPWPAAGVRGYTDIVIPNGQRGYLDGSTPIAWFGPFPPVQTGVAAYNADLVAALSRRGYAIDTYPEPTAHDFPWRHRQRPYSLVVHQFGNSSHHDYQWPYACRFPGLAVLHDTRLHHARAALLLRERRRADYRAEFRWNQPATPADAAEIAVAGLDSALYYDWPMCRTLVERSRLVAVHGDGTRHELVKQLSDGRDGRDEYAERIVSIRLGHGQLVSAEDAAAARQKVRSRYGIAEDAVLFAVFGGLTPEKRIAQVLDAFRATLPYAPAARLMLAGAPAAHLHLALEDGTPAGQVIVTGYIEGDEAFTEHLAAADVSLNLRWPTARETSGPWLRALAAGRATVVMDLAHTARVPALDPRTWTVPAGTHGGQPVCVAIDILDEDHSLRLAMRRLAGDAALRESLGAAARRYWQREHSIEAMADDYERILAQAASIADPRPAVPAHLLADGDERLRALLAPFGLDTPW
jgi:glycosyltransferase involved in cell wall biosynthesis